MSLNREALVGEKELVRLRLEYSIQHFYDNPSEDSLTAIFDELVYASIYNLPVHIPVEVKNGNVAYKLEHISNIGYVYIAYTSAEELLKYSEESSVIVSIRKLFDRVADDSLPGLVINLLQNRNVVIFLNKENIQRILNTAFNSISAQPEDVRNFLIHEI